MNSNRISYNLPWSCSTSPPNSPQIHRPSYTPNFKFLSFGFLKLWSLVYITEYSSEWALPRSRVSRTQWVKTDSAPSSHQMTAAPQSAGGLHAHLPHLHSKTLSDLSLLRPCSCFYLICAAVLCCPENTISLKSSTTSGSYDLLRLSWGGLLWSGRPVWGWALRASPSLLVEHLGFHAHCYLCKTTHFDEGWAMHKIYRHREWRH